MVPEGEGPSRDSAPSTLAQRKSLHTVRMASTTAQPDYAPEWKENGQLKWVPVQAAEEPAVAEPVVDSPVPRGDGLPDNSAQQAQPYDALHREIADLKQTMLLMAQGGQQQQPVGPQPPNPDDFDLYEPAQVKEFHKLNNAYIQATVHQSVQAALAPHQGAMQSAEYTRQYNSVLADYGDNPNFKPYMDAALQLVAQSDGRYSIPEAYDRVELEAHRKPQPAAQPAQPQSYAKPAQRTLTAQEAAQKAAQAHSLPPRNGVSGAAEPGLPLALQRTDCLGRIMLHNQQQGRARPYLV